MDHDLEVAYLGIEVPEPATLTSFFADIVGLVPGAAGPSGGERWRNDDRVHRIIVEPGPASDARFLGVEATSAEAYDRVVDRWRRAGFETTDGSDDDRADRGVERLCRTRAPWGVEIELVLGLRSADEPFSSPLVPGGFLTEGVGFGHAVFATTAFDESHAFLVDGLGLVQSDWLETEIVPGIDLEVRFYHGNRRHHSVALARAPFELPQSLHHVMVETNERDDVGAAFDRAWATELPIPNGLGRHANDEMFSFYVESPAGFQVEIGHGARVVGDDWDDNRRYDRISSWGHQALRPPAFG